jgi:hypothetical protein
LRGRPSPIFRYLVFVARQAERVGVISMEHVAVVD